VTERDDDERVTLAALDPETALRALLAVKPGKDNRPHDEFPQDDVPDGT
jgi:hypothetical protein